MNESIAFPHLGIYLDHVGKSFSVGGFEIAYYGVVIAVGMLVGILLVFRLAKHTGQEINDYENLALLGIVFGILGARAYYVIFSWSDYKGDLKSIINIREGGLAIYGGIIAGFLTAFIYARVRHLSFFQIADTVCVGFPAGQMIGRWGNFFNREAFGEYTDSLFAMRLPLSAVRAGDVTEKMTEHIVTADGVRTIQVHPTFLYESAWCLVILIILLIVSYKSKKRFTGEVFLLYLGLYGFGRFFIEGLRTDQLKIGAVPVSQVLSALLVLICFGIITGKKIAAKQTAKTDK